MNVVNNSHTYIHIVLCHRFGGVEDEFEEFATTQNVNKEEIISLVKENEDILDLMRVSCYANNIC